LFKAKNIPFISTLFLFIILIRYSYDKNRGRKKSQNYDAGIEKYDTGKKAEITPVKCSLEISRSKEDRRWKYKPHLSILSVL